MRSLVALLLLAAAAAAGCARAPVIPDQVQGPVVPSRGKASEDALAQKVGRAREHCRDARAALRKDARDIEKSHNLWATLGATFGASAGAAALTTTADLSTGVKNTLTITGALLSVAGAVATGVSSKDADSVNRLSERALKIKALESEVDSLVAARKVDESGEGGGSNDEAIARKVDELEEACAEL